MQPNVSLNAVACTSATVCVAVGRNETTNEGVIAQYNGSTWTVKTSAAYGTLGQLSCASSALCLAVTENNQSYLTYNPTTKVATAAQPQSLGESVTCVSATRCWSGGDVYNGSTWTYDETVPSGTIT